MTKLLAVILAIALTACATGELAQHLEEGMSKEQAISILGKPDGFQRSGACIAATAYTRGGVL
ncbi:MAG: outer membrane protein assembly factor BamE [Acidobacteriota bacterium]|nr:outer membrane protein assembly factor BamE [Acidobacteriota bacterium]